jgi:predicted Zn-dependent peptidase
LKPIAAFVALGLAGSLLTSAALAAPAPALKPAPAAKLVETLSYAKGTPLHRYVLPNGLTVLLLPLKNATITTMHTWVRAGSRNEKPGITGIAHLFEHMMFRPVKSGEKSYFDQAAALGLNYNASTRFNATDYYDAFTPELLPQVVKMEANRFRNMKVTPELLKVEREAVRSEYSTKFDANPMIDLWFWVYKLAFGSHPYGWHIIGQREDLDRITADDANRFFQQNYVPNNTLVAIAGPIDPAATMQLLSQQFGPWKRGPEPKKWTNVPAVGKAPVVGHGKLKSPSKYMLIGYRTPDRTAPDRLAHDLATYILFNGQNSLVYKHLLDKLAIASVADGFNTFYDIALDKVLVLPNPGVKPETIHTEVQNAIAGFKNLSDADYEAFRQAYATDLREGQLKTHDVTAALGRAWAYDGDFKHAFTDDEAILKLPKSAVAAAIAKTYQPKNRVTAITP